MKLALTNVQRIMPRLLWAVALFAITLSTQAQFFSKKTEQLLPEEEAFVVAAAVEDGVLRVSWSIAEDYYMYREQFSVESNDPAVQIGEISFPQGEVEDDPEFGEVEVYFYNVDLTMPISADKNVSAVELTLKGQGCNKPVGICYPPQTRLINVAIDSTLAKTGLDPKASNDSTQTVSKPVTDKSFWAYVLAALGAGVLLSFTPCVLPMIPILAGVIAGQRNISKLKSGWLAICYVAGTIVTYAIAGWVAGASGTQLQAHFQNPWVIGSICALLLLLSASLFGAFKIELPSSLQTKLSGADVSNRSVSVSSFFLGLISALVVGACVSPILIITLGAAITQGDPVLGAAIMSAMALGMGLLLIVFGFGAGWILPKTGAWMTEIQVVFGFMVLGVAIYLASGLDAVPSLLLWSALLLWAGFYLWQLSGRLQTSMLSSLIRATAFALSLWGSMSLVGAATDGDDVLAPLSSLSFSSSVSNSASGNGIERSGLPFQTTTKLSEVNALLGSAASKSKPVMIDFYADWCLDCKRMHKTTFKKAAVADALQGWDLIEIDVTKTNDDSEQVKRFFSVFGPPATLFFDPSGKEFADLRQYGYMREADFLAILNRAQY